MIKRRNMWMQVLLMVITLGIYAIYWFYVTSKEMIEYKNLDGSASLWTVRRESRTITGKERGMTGGLVASAMKVDQGIDPVEYCLPNPCPHPLPAMPFMTSM